MGIRSVLVILTFAALAAMPRAEAQFTPCAGFTDVHISSGFCNDVTWLKNREVTLGCTSATLYCPNSLVARLSMAAFMNRVGNVLTPNVFSIEDSGGPLDLLSEHILCVTPDLPPRPYGRRVLVDAVLSYDVAGPVNLDISVVTSVSSIGGGIWLQVQTARVAVSPNARNHQHVMQPARPITILAIPDGLVRYAVSVKRTAPILSSSITGWTCHLQVVAFPDVEL
jgi:hypothetical protein